MSQEREPANQEREQEHEAQHPRDRPEGAPSLQEVRPTADALAARTRLVQVSPLYLENERVLPPGAGGVQGVPYKMLRTQVLRRLDKLGVNSLAVVGAAADTGKTLTAINLAIAIAADPERTSLLIDLDLRKPSVHRRFGLEPEVGIDDCLRRARPLKDAMVRIETYERFVLLPARERSVDSSELLSTRRTEEMILEMRSRYKDRVLVFDLPPVPQADDALVFARHVQAVLIVVGEGRTRRDDLLRTIELLRDVPIIGTVLNGTREPVHTYY
ncbi:MAG TPA: CpsD/CapB family tyrosine-protein kinase [Steroidobacteraceae bacterium]|nr:CpsD/CapB family tyrosine-protein kinase [Steroidobacteraceae bacterium]